MLMLRLVVVGNDVVATVVCAQAGLGKAHQPMLKPPLSELAAPVQVPC